MKPTRTTPITTFSLRNACAARDAQRQTGVRAAGIAGQSGGPAACLCPSCMLQCTQLASAPGCSRDETLGGYLPCRHVTQTQPAYNELRYVAFVADWRRRQPAGIMNVLLYLYCNMYADTDSFDLYDTFVWCLSFTRLFIEFYMEIIM